MNIGFDAKRAFNNKTGLGSYSRTLISGLISNHPSNRYFFFTPQQRYDFLRNETKITIIKPQRFIHKTFKWYWRSFYIPQEERKVGLDIYHGLSNELPFGKPPAGVKQVVTIHDLIFLKYPQFYPLIDRNIYKRKVKHSCGIADCIITVSEQTQQDLIEWLPFTKGKIKIVYQACDSVFEKEIAISELNRIREKFSLPKNYILYVGAISERKNLMNLVKAFAMLPGSHNLSLILVGQGSTYKKKIEDLVKSLKLSGKIRIISNVETRDLPAIYRMAKLFVYPSIYEGFGIPIIEAMFSKVPVLTTEGGCFREAGGLQTCYANTSDLNDLSEKMHEVLFNAKLQDLMINEGRIYVQRFKSEAVSKKLTEIYSSLIP